MSVQILHKVWLTVYVLCVVLTHDDDILHIRPVQTERNLYVFRANKYVFVCILYKRRNCNEQLNVCPVNFVLKIGCI